MRDTRSTLLTEAETLVRGRGYSGFSYADLAEAVGIRKASIHHHFPTKTDLAIALLGAYSGRYADALEGILASSEDGIVRVLAYADLYLGGASSAGSAACARRWRPSRTRCRSDCATTSAAFSPSTSIGSSTCCARAAPMARCGGASIRGRSRG